MWAERAAVGIATGATAAAVASPAIASATAGLWNPSIWGGGMFMGSATKTVAAVAVGGGIVANQAAFIYSLWKGEGPHGEEIHAPEPVEQVEAPRPLNFAR